jgi:hypothetical protein
MRRGNVYPGWAWLRAVAVCAAFGALGATGCDSETVNRVDPPKAVSGVPDSPGVVAVRRSADAGFLSLRIDEATLARLGDAMHVQVRMVCKFVPARNEWQRLPASPTRIAYRMEPRPDSEANAPERLLYELPREAGLFWMLWIEERERDGVKGATRERQALAASGGEQCGDTHGIAEVSPAKNGRITVCVPGDGRGEQREIADPAVACAELR